MNGSFPKIFLLLGSYDNITKSILERIKDNVEAAFTANQERVMALLLDETEIYKVPLGGKELVILIEKYDGGITLFAIDEDQIKDTIDYPRKSDKDINGIISQYINNNYKTKNYEKLALKDKLRELASISTSIFLARDQELTRCGEYIELMFLLTFKNLNERLYFFKRDGIDVSEMLWEVLDAYNPNIRPYKNEGFLFDEIIRIVRTILKGG